MATGYFRGITKEEQETIINYDYFGKEIVFYTTYEHVFDNMLKRLKDIEGVKVNRSEATIRIPISACRQPQYIVKVKNRKSVTK